MNFQRLQQIVNEETYSKSTIRALVEGELLDSMEGLRAKYEHGITLVREYLSKNFFHQKQVHINSVRKRLESDEAISEVISLIIVNVMSKKGQQPIQSVTGDVERFLDIGDQYYGLLIAADLVGVICNTDLYDVYGASDSEIGSMTVICRLHLSPEIQAKVDKKMYLPPLICEPKEITTNWSRAYYSEKGSVILGRGNHHEFPLALDALNIANNVAMSIDERILDIPEQPAKILDTEQKKKNFERLKEQSSEVYQLILDSGNVFYNEHKYDERGRMYSQGYHIHIQSYDYKKSLIRLAKQETIPLD